ncbi:MAG: hypothetical protein II502_05385 [Paludibacteraceae bacterium]|nr:hypothetical protein [Paludibacteraceae bacterium]
MKTMYECSHSKAVKWMTVVFVAVTIAAIATEVWYVSMGVNHVSAIVIIIVLLLALLSCFFLYPQYIIADDEGIGIHTLLSTRRIPYSDIDRIERAPENFMSNTNTLRLFGIGGVLGFIGFFKTKGIGTYRSFVTDKTKAFLIYRTKGLPVAISVSEPDEFMPYYLKGRTKDEPLKA